MSPRAPAWHSLMFRCAIVVGLVFLLTMSSQERVRAAHARPEGAEGRRHFGLGLRIEVGRVSAVPGSERRETSV